MWIKECKKFGGDKLTPVLVGNKTDLKKEVGTSAIDAFLEKYKLNYYEVSAKDYNSVKKFFNEFASSVNELKLKDKK